MAELIEKPTQIPVPGGKVIAEYVGRVNNGETAVSVAPMVAPGGWTEPAQQPSFDEYTLVLKGSAVAGAGVGLRTLEFATSGQGNIVDMCEWWSKP